eukprot:13297260-Alexandrium_andersonii.AAC.1
MPMNHHVPYLAAPCPQGPRSAEMSAYDAAVADHVVRDLSRTLRSTKHILEAPAPAWAGGAPTGDWQKSTRTRVHARACARSRHKHLSR